MSECPDSIMSIWSTLEGCLKAFQSKHGYDVANSEDLKITSKALLIYAYISPTDFVSICQVETEDCCVMQVDQRNW